MVKMIVDAAEAVEDIRAGMDDASLMEKHRLSARGLQSLFSKLVKADLLKQSELDERIDLFVGTVILAEDIVAAVAQVSIDRDSAEETIDYSVGEETECRPAQMEWAGGADASVSADAGPLPLEKRHKQKVNAEEASRLITSGTSDIALMETYRLSARGLQSLLRKLEKAGFIDSDEVDARLSSIDATVDLKLVIDELGFGAPSEPSERKTDKVGPPHEKSRDSGGISRQHGERRVYAFEPTEPPDEKVPWYENRAAVIVLMIVLFPVGLYALYRTPRFSASLKGGIGILWAIVVIALGATFLSTAAEAEALVGDIRKTHARVCRVELRGGFNRTLRIYWTNQTKKQDIETSVSSILRDKQLLLKSRVTYLEVPNKSGTFDLKDLRTGGRTKTGERAPYFYVPAGPGPSSP